MNIGVARPSPEELSAVRHHFIACRSVQEPYNVFTFEQDALRLLDRLFQQHDTVVAVGGSGLYIEALSHGISVLPDPTPELRKTLQLKLRDEGVESLRAMLKTLDPDYYSQVDLANGVRIQRALEVCLTTGKPYSQLIQQPRTPRPFTIETIVIERSREELNALNTVGYKEFFNLWEGINTSSLSPADAIKLNTWHYAKKQLTWLKKRVPQI